MEISQWSVSGGFDRIEIDVGNDQTIARLGKGALTSQHAGSIFLESPLGTLSALGDRNTAVLALQFARERHSSIHPMVELKFGNIHVYCLAEAYDFKLSMPSCALGVEMNPLGDIVATVRVWDMTYPIDSWRIYFANVGEVHNGVPLRLLPPIARAKTLAKATAIHSHTVLSSEIRKVLIKGEEKTYGHILSVCLEVCP